jgi:asparagine synthase (glutamine-hydrolysing)
MCGIAGVLYADPNRPAARSVLERMSDAIAHRGPDAEGFLIEAGVGLVHRRLAIVDLAGGDQPIGNEDGSVQVVFNGEIYNHEPLRRTLQSHGHRFRTRSDTEVLVHMYEHEAGDSGRLCTHLRGMFAFAIWDRVRRQLVLARDRLGIKPLYIYRDAEKLLFASELKGILAHPDVPRDLDPTALDGYLAFGVVTGRQSIFRQIQRLAPANTLAVRADSLNASPARYWQLRFDPDESTSCAVWQETIRAKVDESVRLHLMADVPVGAFLSGGVDSTIVAGSAAAACRGPLNTFSIGFTESSFNELPFARAVAERLETTHTEELVTPDAADLLDDLTWYYDEPFADASALPTFLVSRLAARQVKVVLSGDGGDEAFGGYARYVHDLREAAVRRSMPGWFRRGLLGPLSRLWPRADWLPRPMRLRTMFQNLAQGPDAAYANTLARCRQPLRRSLIAPHLVGVADELANESLIRAAYGSAPAGDPLAAMIAADVDTVLPDDFLVKVDRASMACGLELRPPLLDHELLELAARVPSRWKVRNGQGKWIFKEAFRAELPDTARRRRKQGFDVPIDDWLRGPLSAMFCDLVLSPTAAVAELIDQGQARRLYRTHRRGWGRHGQVLWSLLVLARWADRFLRGQPLATRPALPFGRAVQSGASEKRAV